MYVKTPVNINWFLCSPTGFYVFCFQTWLYGNHWAGKLSQSASSTPRWFPTALPLSLSSSSRSSGPASWWMLSDRGFLSFSDSLLVLTMAVQLSRATSPVLVWTKTKVTLLEFQTYLYINERNHLFVDTNKYVLHMLPGYKLEVFLDVLPVKNLFFWNTSVFCKTLHDILLLLCTVNSFILYFSTIHCQKLSIYYIFRSLGGATVTQLVG